MIIGEIKTHIEYGVVDPTFVGKWYKGLSDGTIKILIDKGYIIKRSAEHCDEFAVLFSDADVGIPYEKSVSFGGKSEKSSMLNSNLHFLGWLFQRYFRQQP